MICQHAPLILGHAPDRLADAHLVHLAGFGEVLVRDGIAALEVRHDHCFVDHVLDRHRGVADGVMR
jgi:hypothetical protein